MKRGTEIVVRDPIMMAESVIQWLSFPHGAKADTVARSALIFGVSKQQMYRLLKEFNNFRPYIEAKYGAGKRSEKRLSRMRPSRYQRAKTSKP